jgi:hypothetical protein
MLLMGALLRAASLQLLGQLPRVARRKKKRLFSFLRVRRIRGRKPLLYVV